MTKSNKPTGKSNVQLGKEGEDLAVAYLVEQGYSILVRNYRALHAEIDIICEDCQGLESNDADLVFVEVKTRATHSHGSPLEAITQRKLAHVKRAANHYLYEFGIGDRICRFDVIGIQLGAGPPQIEHVQDVVDY